jgi:hypothetical protein
MAWRVGRPRGTDLLIRILIKILQYLRRNVRPNNDRLRNPHFHEVQQYFDMGCMTVKVKTASVV